MGIKILTTKGGKYQLINKKSKKYFSNTKNTVELLKVFKFPI